MNLLPILIESPSASFDSLSAAYSALPTEHPLIVSPLPNFNDLPTLTLEPTTTFSEWYPDLSWSSNVSVNEPLFRHKNRVARQYQHMLSLSKSKIGFKTRRKNFMRGLTGTK